jgi:hypothetical protein
MVPPISSKLPTSTDSLTERRQSHAEYQSRQQQGKFSNHGNVLDGIEAV